MIFRDVDKNGDWVFGSGRQAYQIENAAIGLDITTKLKTFLTECFFDATVGVPWFNLLGSKDKDFFILTLKKAIGSVAGVVSVNDLEYNFDTTRNLTVKYEISTIYTTSFTGTLQV
jgi:hypothetical protein